MAKLELTGQNAAKDKIEKEIDALVAELGQRASIWKRLDIEKKKNWVGSVKDPMVSAAWNMHKYLRNFFEGIE